MTRRFLFLIMFLLIFSAETFGQIIINGVVTYSSDGLPVDLANIIIEDTDRKSIIAYCTTDSKGRFTISIKSGYPSIVVTVAGFNVERKSVVVPTKSQTIEISVKYKEVYLQAAKIRTNPIKRSRDTISYYVSMFSDSLDYSIGDVLKKMPGISVDKAGGIRYQGKSIDKFYIEGLDLMGERYGVATKNVRARDIVTVEIYENHQPVKLMKNMFGDSLRNGVIAVNLKLKQESKGVFIPICQAGIGCGPLQWDASFAGMYFSSTYQMFSTAKSNNSGKDIISELAEQYNGNSLLKPIIGVYNTSTPDIDLERYMDNTTHTASINNLVKLSKDDILSINGIYSYDRQVYADSSRSEYFMPSDDPLKIYESTKMITREHCAEMKIKYTGNGEKAYIKETLSARSEWSNNNGTVLNGNIFYDQVFNGSPNVNVQNDFSYSGKAARRIMLNVNSNVNVSNLPSSLEITPSILPSVFGYSVSDTDRALQRVSHQSLFTKNSLCVSTGGRKTFFMADLNFQGDIQNMTSMLSGRNGNETWPELLKNDMKYSRFSLGGSFSVDVRFKRLKFGTIINIDYTKVGIDNRIKRSSSTWTRPLFNPLLNMEFKLSYNLKLLLLSDYSEQYGSAVDSYSGYIMTDYRTVCTRDGEIALNKIQKHNLDLKYSNTISSLFAYINVSYWRRKSDVIYGTTYIGNLAHIESYSIDNVSEGYSVGGKVSKYFLDIASTMELYAKLEHYWMDILRQGKVMNEETISPKTGFKCITNWNRSIKMRYNIDYSHYYSKCPDYGITSAGIDMIHQNMSLDFSFIKSLFFNVTGEHYFNGAVVSGSRNICFLDASMTYRRRRVEYVLQADNLLNTRTYSNRIISQASEFEYNYLLRPRTFMLKVKLNIK